MCILDIGLMNSERASWQEEEETRKDTSIVLIVQQIFFFLPPSSSWSFRPQSSWSFITGQCLDSGRFLQVHFSRWMCNQFTFHHEFRIDSGRSKFEQQRDRLYSFCLWIPWMKNTKILRRSTWKHRVLHSTCIQPGRNIKTRCIGSTLNLLKRKVWSAIELGRTLSFFTIHSQLIVSRKPIGLKLKKSFTKNYMNHLDRLRRFLW